MRVTLVVGSLAGGGIARVASTMANYWAERGWAPALVTLDSPKVEPLYPLRPDVLVEHANLLSDSGGVWEALRNNIRRVVRLRRIIRRCEPEVVVSFGDVTNVQTVLAMLATATPVLVSERVDPSTVSIGRVWSAGRSLTYRSTARIVLQTEGVLERAPPSWQRRAVVIPNPVAATDVLADPGSPSACPVLMGMGRLHRQKGFDLLIEAFDQLAGRYPAWRLEIWGDGPERPALEAQIASSKYAGRMSLAGTTGDALGELSRAQLFAFPSRFEGFPNALCEAMSVGLPVVAADCRSGPADIIEANVDGLLVQPESASSLSSALDRAMSDASLRVRLGAAARDISTRFGVTAVMQQWEDALRDACR